MSLPQRRELIERWGRVDRAMEKAGITEEVVADALKSLLVATKREILYEKDKSGKDVRIVNKVPDITARRHGIELTAKFWRLWGDPRFVIPDTSSEESRLLGGIVVELTAKKVEDGWTAEQVTAWFTTQEGQEALVKRRSELLEGKDE